MWLQNRPGRGRDRRRWSQQRSHWWNEISHKKTRILGSVYQKPPLPSKVASPFKSATNNNNNNMWNTPETETTGPPASERPDWLSDNADMESGKAWDSADKPSSTIKPTVEVSPASKTKTDQAAAGEKGPWCKRLTIIGVSALFIAAFIYAAFDGKNQGEKLQWYIYYALSAAIPIFFLCHYIMCFPVKVIYLLSVGMACWSIVKIIVASLDLKDNPKNEDLVWELTGVSAGLLSALYHACASNCFVTSKGKNDE